MPALTPISPAPHLSRLHGHSPTTTTLHHQRLPPRTPRDHLCPHIRCRSAKLYTIPRPSRQWSSKPSNLPPEFLSPCLLDGSLCPQNTRELVRGEQGVVRRCETMAVAAPRGPIAPELVTPRRRTCRRNRRRSRSPSNRPRCRKVASGGSNRSVGCKIDLRQGHRFRCCRKTAFRHHGTFGRFSSP